MLDSQGELFPPYDAEALCVQLARRIAHLRHHLTPEQRYRLYAELSLSALVVDTLERQITSSLEYRRSFQAAPLYTPESLERASPAWATRWARRRHGDRGGPAGGIAP